MARICLPLVCRWEVNRASSSLTQEPLIVVANHLSNFDIPILVITVPERIAFLGQERLFHPPLGPLWKSFGSFPVRQGKVDRQAFRQANDVLKNKGWALGMFPEGVKSPNSELLPAYLGTAFIALHSNAHILPVGIAGTENITHKLSSPPPLLNRPLVRINIGKPFKLPHIEGRPSQDQLHQFTNIIMGQVAKLLPEGYRGLYGDICDEYRKS